MSVGIEEVVGLQIIHFNPSYYYMETCVLTAHCWGAGFEAVLML